MSEFEDKLLKCICGNDFPFTAGEQEFYQDKDLTPPKRCKDCREKKKQNRENSENHDGRNRYTREK